MMYETGEAISLKEMLDKFLVFAQKYNESTVSWQLIDDRSDSFFGSTLKIPLGEYKYTGYRDKKIWMINSSDFFDNVVFDGNKSIYMDSLVPMFEKMLDGSHISVVNVENKATAANLLKALKKQTDLPDVVFFGGVTETMLADGNIDSYDALVDWCKEKKIELRLFYFSHDSKNKYKDDVGESKHQFFYFRDEILNDPMEEVVEVQEEYERKNDSIFFSNFTIYWREKDVPKHFKDRSEKEEEQSILDRPRKESFSRFMKKIDIIMNIMLKTFRPVYYTSFQYRNITGGSYEEFFRTKHDVMSEEINKVEGVGGRSIRGKDGIQAFNDTGEMIAVGLHMSYDRDLWMAEQGNITCEAEAGDGTNHMNLLPFWDFRGGTPYQRLDIPEYPGTGCPWLTIADRNKSEYGIDKDNKIKYYFSKSNKCATIVFRIMDKSRIYTDCWQTLVFGCFKYDTYSTIPPLYVAGGNQSLVPDVWVYFSPDLHVNGLRYLLDMKNPCLSNSNLAYPTDFGGAHMSNFRVLCYDGKWRDVFSMQQTYSEYKYFDVCGAPIYQWGVPVNQHSYIDSNSSHIHKPKQHLDEVYRSNKLKYNLKDRHLLKNPVEVSIKPKEGEDEHNIHGVIDNCYMVPDFDKESGELETKDSRYVLAPNGWDERLWHYPWYAGRIYWGGENAAGINSAVYNTQVSNEQAYKSYHDRENHYEGNENKINTKLLLKTGEVEHIRDFDLETENNITKDNENTEQRRKLMELYIHIEKPVGITRKIVTRISNTGDDTKDYKIEFIDYPTITELQFYADGRTLLVDWGDGSEYQYYTGWENLTEYRHYSDGVNKRRYRTRMRHIYPDKGNYVITIYAENNDSYKNTFKLHKDLDRHQGIVQFFAEVPVKKELPVYDEKEKLTDKKKIVDSVMKFCGGLSIDGATVPRENDEVDYKINPDFYYAVERPKFDLTHKPNIGQMYNIDGLVQTELDEDGKEFVVPDQPLLGEANGERERYSQEEKIISSNWLGSLVNYQLNGRFEDIFENQDKTWWMILQRTGETDKLKEDFCNDFFGGKMKTVNLKRKDPNDLTDFYFYEKNIVEDKKSWIHIYESTFKNIYFNGVRDSVYLDIHNIEYWDVQIHLCKRAKLLCVDHFPEPKNGNKIRFNIYSDTVFHVVDMSGNMKHYPFYCKKEQIDKFSKANPELTFKELIV